uniref:Uncharacterized protein n=1 Tax=Panagrolaimus sp. JU765 TaxID=591449 RepID=A0AC34Q0K5_9BILA
MFEFDYNADLSLPDDFIVDYVQEIYSANVMNFECTTQLFQFIKRVFPNVNTVTINFLSYEEYFEDDIAQIKEVICQAPQEYVHVLSRIDVLQNERRLMEAFDGKKIDEDSFEWKMESNGKKTIKLHIVKKIKSNFSRFTSNITFVI